MSSCGVCGKSVNRAQQEKVSCAECKSLFHLQCANLTKSDLDFITEQRPWTCEKCIGDRRRARAHVDSPVRMNTMTSSRDSSGGQLTLEAVQRLLDKQKEDIIGEVSRLNGLLEQHVRMAEEQQRVIERLQKENSDLRKSVADLGASFDELEQYGRRNTIEIRGVPESENENVASLVANVGQFLGVNVDEKDIDVCHRLRRGVDSSSTGIVVKFVRRGLADRLVDGGRANGKLTSHQLNCAVDRPDRRVFINRSLTKTRRVWLARARQELRAGRLKYVWVDYSGKVKVRKTAGGKVHTIRSNQDIESALKETE
jgi:uncharacterized protein YoxC